MYFFVFGNHPQLSLAETLSAFSPFEITSFEGNILLMKPKPSSANLKIWQSKLGGTVKIGEILSELTPYVSNIHALSKHITASCINVLQKNTRKDKIRFGFSFYAGFPTLREKKIQKAIPMIGMEIKKSLQTKGQRARLVTSKTQPLSSVIVQKNRLIDETSGFEFVLLCMSKKLWLGITKTVQDFEGYASRDMERPRRNARSGMLPPKLAKIMINLSRADPGKHLLLDPFCGSGTILSEALLLGFRHVIGTDADAAAAAATQKNIQWISKKILHYDPASIKIFVSDIQTLHKRLPPSSIDICVTEPLLGPPLWGNEGRNILVREMKKLSDLYRNTFRVLHTLLKKNSRLVIVFPEFRYQILPHLDPEIHALGFASVNLSQPGIDLSKLTYARPNQKIIRHIRMFEKR